MIDYALILKINYQNAEWTLDGDDYAGLTWLSESTKPTKKTLDDLWPSTLQKHQQKLADDETKKNEILSRLGLTSEEVKLLLKAI